MDTFCYVFLYGHEEMRPGSVDMGMSMGDGEAERILWAGIVVMGASRAMHCLFRKLCHDIRGPNVQNIHMSDAQPYTCPL